MEALGLLVAGAIAIVGVRAATLVMRGRLAWDEVGRTAAQAAVVLLLALGLAALHTLWQDRRRTRARKQDES